jgi:hypothetical protein
MYFDAFLSFNIGLLIESIDQYITTFQWNTMKYRTDKSLQETTATLSQVIFMKHHLLISDALKFYPSFYLCIGSYSY